MKVLFVCSANKIRSLTAELHFSEKYPQHEFDSAGTNHKTCQKEGTTPLEESHLEWADLVLVMEDKHRKIINQHSEKKYNKKIHVLGIKDIYEPFQKELVKILEKKVDRHLQPITRGSILMSRPVESYILSIGDILIASDSILNSPRFSVSMHYHDLQPVFLGESVVFGGNNRILSAIKHEELHVEMVYDQDVFQQLMQLYGVEGQVYKPTSLTILRSNFEIYSIGKVTSVSCDDGTMGFTFLPDYVVNG